MVNAGTRHIVCRREDARADVIERTDQNLTIASLVQVDVPSAHTR
jgi:hypothetical protein